LKAHYSLKPKLVSLHEHNEKARIPRILSLMKDGKTFALISDAGSPLLSDPGLDLTRAVIQAGFSMTCIPGPSAIPVALVLSGFPTQPFSFLGFPPASLAARKGALAKLSALSGHTLVLFESPVRILSLVRELGEVLGDREIAVCRELTKVHEEVVRGKISEVISILSPRKLLGEFTLVVAPGEAAPIYMTDETIIVRFKQLQKEGLSKREALKKMVHESGRTRNELYSLLMK
jgi:16S rRNA (cytidine1402-2'-O)-methyltransferase